MPKGKAKAVQKMKSSIPNDTWIKAAKGKDQDDTEENEVSLNDEKEDVSMKNVAEIGQDVKPEQAHDFFSGTGGTKAVPVANE